MTNFISKFIKVQFFKEIHNKLNKTKNFVDKIPFISGYLELVYHFLSTLKFVIVVKTLELNIRSKYGKLNFNKICWVNPKKIEYRLGKEYNKWGYSSRILDGNWDQSKNRFSDLMTYQAIRDRFQEGKKWGETEFYQLIINRLSQGIKNWGFYNKEDLDRSIRRTESLYYQMKKVGYKSKSELYSSKKLITILENLKSKRKILDDIALAIGRAGQLIFINGKHRLSIAKLLNIPQIPSVFVVRHKKWMEFRKNLIIFSKKCQGGKLDYQLLHPDLQDIPFKYGDLCFNLIKENLSISHGTLLDIGANLGYFCSKFEDEGLDCYAVEENRACLYFLKKLKKIENKEFKIIAEPVFEYKKNQELRFDVALALNLSHHFLEREDEYPNLINFLKRLKVKELFLGIHNQSKIQNKKIYRNYNPNQFINFIIENSCLNKVQLIGKIENDRVLYKFT